MEPFLGSAALRSGRLARRALARDHRAIYRDVYLPRDVEPTARLRAQATWLSTGATLGGTSAAAVLGAKWIDPRLPAQIIRPDRHAPSGMVVHSWSLAAGEVCVFAGVDTTTPARTTFGSRAPGHWIGRSRWWIR